MESGSQPRVCIAELSCSAMNSEANSAPIYTRAIPAELNCYSVSSFLRILSLCHLESNIKKI